MNRAIAAKDGLALSGDMIGQTAGPQDVDSELAPALAGDQDLHSHGIRLKLVSPL